MQIETNTNWLKNARKKLEGLKTFSIEKGIVKYKEQISKKR
jgi:hypothetical protein